MIAVAGRYLTLKADQFELFAPRTALPNGSSVAGPPKGYREKQQWIVSTLSEPARSWALRVLHAPERGVIGTLPPPPPKGLPRGAAARILKQLGVVATQQRPAAIPATERKDVQAPGSRGSTKWRRAGEQQKVRYDEAPAPTPFDDRATPGTRVQWHGLGEWLSGYETLARRARKPSAGAHAAIKAHLAALDRETIAGATSTDQLRNAQLILRNMQPATALGRAEHATTQRLQWVNDRLYALGEKPGKAPQMEVRAGAGIAPRSPRHIADEIRPLRTRRAKGEDVDDQLARLNEEMVRALDAMPDEEVAKRVKAWGEVDQYRENKRRGAKLVDDLVASLPPSGGVLEWPSEKAGHSSRWLVVSRDTHPGSPGWRATKFDDHGVYGHDVGPTPAEAVRAAVDSPNDWVRLRHGSVAEFERLTQSESFRSGTRRMALTNAWNRLMHAGRDEERAKLDELTRSGDLDAAERYLASLDWHKLEKADAPLDLGAFFSDMRMWGWL